MAVAVLEAALVPTVILYESPWESAVVKGAYITVMAAIWLGFAVAALGVGRSLVRALPRNVGRGAAPQGRARHETA